MPTPVGLCATCEHAHRTVSDRGSVFYRCGLAKTDPQFSKYPPLPVLACPGWQAASEKPRQGPPVRHHMVMRTAAALFFLACVLNTQPASAELKAVDTVDLDRYMGRWYELARLPNRFQDDCASDTTATYSMQPDGKLSVVNACRKADGSMMSAEGAARRVGDAKLKVRFAPAWLSFLPMVWGDYWVIDLADDYSWAVVGEPSFKYFWILSREPQMEAAVMDGIVDRAEQQGYDLSKLQRTEQSTL